MLGEVRGKGRVAARVRGRCKGRGRATPSYSMLSFKLPPYP